VITNDVGRPQVVANGGRLLPGEWGFESSRGSHLAVAQRGDRDHAPGMPVTIYRPSIVIGNSTMGETQNFDGPYYLA
jgi:hypothetical protein